MAGTNVQTAVSEYMAARVDVSVNTMSSHTSSNGDSFKNVMDRASGKSFKTESKVKEGLSNNNAVKNRDFTNKLKKINEINEKEALEQNGAAVSAQVIDEYKQQIAAELGITAEELDVIMEEMNIKDYQLFDAATLGDIVLNVYNLEQPQDLLFNAEAANCYKDIVAIMEETDMKLSETDMDDLMNEAQTESFDVNYEENMSQEVQSSDSSKNSAGNNGTGGKKNNDVRDLHADLNADNIRLSNSNTMENLEQILSEKIGKIQSESILSQLTEQIKVNVNGEFKSMEMQLYPEHLGKVGVQIAVKDGVVTAQISAETEAVKKVLEAQLSTLKENFNNQGLKVENVEVTIASHSFEQNNMSNGQSQEQARKGRKSGKADASLIDEINEITAEDNPDKEGNIETLGNTVSYSA